MVRNLLLVLVFAGGASALPAAPLSLRGADASGDAAPAQRSATFQLRLRPPPATMPMTDY